MKFLLSFVVMIPMLAAAGEVEKMPGGYYPYPGPNPRYCPEGTHSVFDEYKGRYICVQDDAREPRPLPWRTDRMKELSGALGGDDMSAKGAALNGLFDAAQSRKSDASAVSAGSWGNATSGLSRPKSMLEKNKVPKIVLAAEMEHRDMMEETGQAIKDKIIEKVIDKAIEKVENANKRIDEIGNGLRSDGDSALQKGTQAQKDAERKNGK